MPASNEFVLSADALAALATPAPVKPAGQPEIVVSTTAADTLAAAAAAPKPAGKPVTVRSGKRDIAAKPAKPAKPDAKPAPVAVAVAAKPVSKPADTAALPSRDIVRTAATVARNATHYGAATTRDDYYLAFFASFCRKASNGSVTLRTIADSKRTVDTGGNFASAKPTDAGVINRLRKAGRITVSADGNTLSFTESQRKLAGKLYTTGA
jgi:hypothetical protein